jgi:hypothetical protein
MSVCKTWSLHLDWNRCPIEGHSSGPFGTLLDSSLCYSPNRRQKHCLVPLIKRSLNNEKKNKSYILSRHDIGKLLTTRRSPKLRIDFRKNDLWRWGVVKEKNLAFSFSFQTSKYQTSLAKPLLSDETSKHLTCWAANALCRGPPPIASWVSRWTWPSQSLDIP